MNIRLVLLPLLLTVAASHGQEYAGDPFLLGAGARALGMGSAFVAVSDDATAIYWNAAGLTQLERPEAQAQHAEKFGGTVNHDVLMAAVPNQMGTFGVGLVRVGVDGITLTALEDPAQPLSPGNRPVATGSVGTSAYILHVSYSRSLRRDISVGATVKMIWRNLEAGDGTGYGLDVGLLYRPRDPWQVGLVIRDLTRTRITFDSGAQDHIFPSLHLGAAYTLPSTFHGRIIIAGSAVFNESGSDAEDGQTTRFGLEYDHPTGLAARVGLEGDHFTAGAGIEPLDRIRIDVAFLENGDLNNTYRISASLYF